MAKKFVFLLLLASSCTINKYYSCPGVHLGTSLTEKLKQGPLYPRVVITTYPPQWGPIPPLYGTGVSISKDTLISLAPFKK